MSSQTAERREAERERQSARGRAREAERKRQSARDSVADMVETVPLNTGARMPSIGFGTWPLDDAGAAEAVASAIEVGYRHIDTATRYGNEAGVAEGIRRSGVDREDIFVTTKLDGEFQGDDRARDGLAASLERMQLDAVDLLLIHWPLPARGDYVSTWKTFESLAVSGQARAIGVSNFLPEHLEELAAASGVVPAVNQIQCNPYVTREESRVYHRDHGIVTVSWGPLGGARFDVLGDRVLAGVAEEVGRTVAQVVLRWHLQLELVAIPKTSSPARMAENLDVFDFELTPSQMIRIASLSQGPGVGVNPAVDGH